MLTSKLKIWTAGGILFLLPFFVLPFNGDMQMQFDMPKLMGVFLLGSICFSFYLSDHISPYFGLAYGAFAVISVLTGFGPRQVYPTLFFGGACYFALWFTDRGESERLRLLRLVAISGILCAFQAYLQTMHVTWPLQYAPGIDQYKPIAFLGQHTKFGAYMAPMCALCVCLGRRWWPFAGLIAFLTILTGSSFSVLGLGVGLLVVARHWVGRRAVAWVAGAGLAALVAVFLVRPDLDMFRNNGRADVWREMIACARQEAPWIGRGPGSFAALFAETCESVRTRELNGKFLQAHNDPLQVFHDGGLVGVTALLVVLFGIGVAYWRTWWRYEQFRTLTSVQAAQGMFAALFANSLGNFPFQLAPHFLLGVTSAAILLKRARRADSIFL